MCKCNGRVFRETSHFTFPFARVVYKLHFPQSGQAARSLTIDPFRLRMTAVLDGRSPPLLREPICATQR